MADLDGLAVQLAEVRQRLKDAGEGGLTRKLSDAIGRAVEPLGDEIRAGLRPRLPNRYADIIGADLDVFRRTYTQAADEARVTVYARTAGPSKRKLRRLDAGILWHPLFGRFPRTDPRNRWFEQGAPSVEPGWFSGPVDDATPRVREEIRKALDDVLQEITR